MILEAAFAHALRIVEVASVEHERLCHLRFHTIEVGAPIRIPLRVDDQSVCPT